MNIKKLGIWTLVIVSVSLFAYGMKVYWDYSYKTGYADGVKKEIICSASERDEALKPLCK